VRYVVTAVLLSVMGIANQVHAFASAAGQQALAGQVVDRLMAYTAGYADSLSTVIADERYDQRVEEVGVGTLPPRVKSTVLKAEYALTLVKGGWIGYRDVIEVDGVKVPDRAGRLERVLAQASASEMNAILDENARFNIYSEYVSRNINVPTLVIQLLHPRYRKKFAFSKNGEETVAGHLLWRIDYNEQTRPTIVRSNGNQDQRVRGSVWVDPMSGAVWRTNLMWEKGPGGNIQVDYGHVAGIEPLVPLKMVERYKDGSTDIRGTAIYSQYRQFRTSGRLLPPTP